MEVTATKRLPLAIAAMSVLFLLTPRVCRATAVESGNESTPSLFSAGHPENGLFADADLQSEFMMDSEINRMLVDLSTLGKTLRALDGNKPVIPCGRAEPYSGTCLPPPNPRRRGEKCGTFNRGCRISHP